MVPAFRPRRKYTPKYKKASITKRKSYGRRRPVRARRKMVASDPTVMMMNGGKDKVMKWSKSLTLNSPGSASTLNLNGFSLSLNSVASYTQSGTMVFDPTGTFGNNSGPINASSGFLALGVANIPEWSSLKNLYAMYKVTKIHLNFNYNCQGNVLFGEPTIYIRYNNQYNAPAPTLGSMSEERHWIKKTFTAEHPNFKYSFYPKVMQLYDNAGIITTDSRVSRSMPWTNLNLPVELYGCKFFFTYQGGGSATTQNYITCDITYEISFKDQF